MRLVILDRDGVINRDSTEYIKSPDEWVPLSGSLEAIARLNSNDYKVIVASNQSAVGRGMIDMDTLNRIHLKMLDQLHQAGGEIEAIFYCPHHPDDQCHCRKPNPGMLESIANRLNISLAGVPVIGDSIQDLQAANAVNALPILVLSGKNSAEFVLRRLAQQPPDLHQSPVYKNLAEFVNALLDGKLDEKMTAMSRGTT